MTELKKKKNSSSYLVMNKTIGEKATCLNNFSI